MFRIIPFYLLAIIAVFAVKNNVFFWDTVQLGAKHAYWYVDQDFRQLLLPEEIDSGHPPAFGIFLALMWELFGRSLPVSHFAMLPFLFGIIFFGARLATMLAPVRFLPFLLLLLSVDPTLGAQALLVSPDVVLVLGFFMGLYAVFTRHRMLTGIAALLLAMTSLRGMMVVVVLFLFDTLSPLVEKKNSIVQLSIAYALKKAVPYVPSGLLALLFLSYHYLQTGWVGYHADSPWAPGFERVDVQGFFYNIGIMGWRLLDFGRVFVWLLGCFLLVLCWKKNKISDNGRRLLLLLGIAGFVLSPSMLTHKDLLLHRYLLPISLSLSLLVFHLLFGADLVRPRFRAGLFALVAAGLLTGNCWIYPPRIAQGWDATLGHLPYYELRSSMFEFLHSNNIAYHQVGTAFPEIGPLKFRDLSDRETGMVEKDLSNQQFIYYTNIMNDFTDAELAVLAQQWRVIEKLEKSGVFVILYGRKVEQSSAPR